jgi:hypothetical protein
MSVQRLDFLIGQLQVVKPDDPVLATQWNLVVETLEEVKSLLQRSTDEHRGSDLTLGELQEDAEADDTGFEVLELQHNRTSGGLMLRDVTHLKTFEPQLGLWLEGERLPFLWDRAEATYGILPMVQVHFGKMDGELASESSATMSVWHVNASGQWADTGKDITVYDWLLKAGSVIAQGKKVVAVQFLQSRRFIVVAAECP